MPSLLDAPVSDADAIVGPGSTAAALSITTTSGPDTVEVLPAGSTPTATNVCDTPLAEPDSGLVNVVVQPPLLSATAEPTDTVVPPVTSYNCTYEPAAAVPLNVGSVAEVMLSWFVPDVPEPNVSDNGDSVSAGGGLIVSTVTGSVLDAGLVLPARSTALAVRLCVPSASDAVWIVQLPLASAVTCPTDVAPSISVTTSPALAVPLIVTRLSLVRPSLGVPAVCRPNVSSTSFRFAGAGSLVSIVTSAAPLNADVLPAMSIWRAVIWCVPSASTPEWIV
ncbi:Uncharacterised protein [Burkholderia pseudomallei]|nr:Uncharacterised protein [Burkholderia pseudomallei]CAJ2955473.1 Uncharacterised protein [Burkholderia pseudomallei]CAJ3037609.1 Uncharacterised protein [Burkholderia pseudomallei]CAJ3164880.1 Uncharacterised protein [Burkholderia pseudomallei]CAJ3523698.1 Uncharacterised protein [Burkholderia pseudomallei]